MKRIAYIFLATIMLISCMAITASAVEVSDNPFDDVMGNDYYYDSVLWAVDNKVTSGITETEFRPAATCTRSQVVTFLWRAYGRPEPKTESNPFVDVDESDYFYKAVLWAVEEGITSGVSADSFAPEQSCSRAHTIAFLWRAAGKPHVSSQSTWAEQYIGTYYYDAMRWAEESGMIWDCVSKFSPESPCPRADIVTYIHYAMEPNAAQKSSNSKSWADHIDKYFYIELVGSYKDSYDYLDMALQIDTAEELAALSAFTNSSLLMRSFPGKYIVLEQDIDLGEYSWEPICIPDAPKDGGAEFYNAGGFNGTFSGNGHEIKNLTINDRKRSILGLFGAVNTGTVGDVTVSGEITGNWNIGGITGYNIAGTIENCKSNIAFKSAGYCVGGIVGQNIGTVSGCEFSGIIEASRSSSGNIGGIAGWAGNCEIRDCICTGRVVGYTRVGGIVGRLQNNGRVLDCQCSGKVSGVTYYDIFVGANDGVNTVVSGCTLASR